jgi:Tfp pilus assembly major pilin PilA
MIYYMANLRSVKNKRKSFTLVEIVFTIAIIGILLAIFLPAMSMIKLSAQKVKDQSNLKTIAKAWYECAINRGWKIDGTPGGFVVSFARQLAGEGKTNISDIVLNDPHIYISPGDKYASKIRGQDAATAVEAISHFKDNVIIYTLCYACTTNCLVTDEYVFSYCFILNLPSGAPLDTTPLGFTRGLNKNGLWDEKSGLYGSKGGYVVYCDGHVVWFDGSKPAKFLKWDQSGYTSDIRETVPDSTWITCTNSINKVKSDYKGENALAIICHQGTGGE